MALINPMRYFCNMKTWKPKNVVFIPRKMYDMTHRHQFHTRSTLQQFFKKSRRFDTDTLIGPVDSKPERKGEPRKLVRVGVIGEPNAGKSTLINSVVGEKVSIISEIMNTTRESIYVPYNMENTQIVFIDTPGIVPFQIARKLKLGRTQITAPRKVIDECDMLAVVIDLQSRRKRERIHECILDLLNDHPEFPSILILNKIDLIKRKSSLLKYVSQLTSDRKKDAWGYENNGGYSKFNSVFMVSASTGDGVQDIVQYLIEHAKEGNWEYENQIKVDLPMDKQIAELFRETLLDSFRHEIPWQVKQLTLLFDEIDDETCRIHQKLIWPKKSQARYVRTKSDLIQAKTQEKLAELLQKKIHLTVDISSSVSLVRQLPF